MISHGGGGLDVSPCCLAVMRTCVGRIWDDLIYEPCKSNDFVVFVVIPWLIHVEPRNNTSPNRSAKNEFVSENHWRSCPRQQAERVLKHLRLAKCRTPVPPYTRPPPIKTITMFPGSSPASPWHPSTVLGPIDQLRYRSALRRRSVTPALPSPYFLPPIDSPPSWRRPATCHSHDSCFCPAPSRR